ncbi:MAG TPA: hypothetical protein VF525_09260 [Pyrinomonadaceae bacterium]|jgi:hypothetical protein
MSSKGKDTGHKALAIMVILALLALMGMPPMVIFFFAVVVYFIWRAVDRSEQHETRRIFDFYLNANEILREDERRWFGFEIREVIEQGETVLHTMKDAPPLVHFALAALYHHIEAHAEAAEHLAYVVEHEETDERHLIAPSPELRRYVNVLRRLEHEPADGPQTLTAIRSLERARRTRAAALLAEVRAQLGQTHALPHAESPAKPRQDATVRLPFGASPAPATSTPPSMPPPITEVLRDVYEEKKTA